MKQPRNRHAPASELRQSLPRRDEISALRLDVAQGLKQIPQSTALGRPYALKQLELHHAAEDDSVFVEKLADAVPHCSLGMPYPC